MKYPVSAIEKQKELIKMFEAAIEETRKKYGKTNPTYCKHSIKQAMETVNKLKKELEIMENPV